jgi:hypothetical protein
MCVPTSCVLRRLLMALMHARSRWLHTLRLARMRPADMHAHMARMRAERRACMQATLGVKALALFGMSAGGAIFFLSVVNYVEHYGLTRSLLRSGQPCPVSYNHSWNANHLVSNASLLRLQRHTDHHMHAYKPFYRLENVEGAPRLPADYSIMYLLALVPPLWFCVMNPRVHLYRLLSEVGTESSEPEGEGLRSVPADST